MSSPGRARPGNHNNGAMLFHDARHPAAKFDDASVRRIRRRFAQGVPARAIAEALGCHYDTIRRIVGGISYGAVPMPTTQTIIPRPAVEVTTTSDDKSHVVISRDGRGRSYEIAGTPTDEAKGQIKDVVEKVIGDHYTAEWLP